MVEHGLFDDPVCPPEHRRRDGQPESFSSLEVDDQLELGGLFDRNVSGLGASENLVDEGCRPAPDVVQVWAVTHQPAGLDLKSEQMHARELAIDGELRDSLGVRLDESPASMSSVPARASAAALKVFSNSPASRISSDSSFQPRCRAAASAAFHA